MADRRPELALEILTTGPPGPLPPCPWRFPLADEAPAEGPAAIGGDFEPTTVVAAYRAGLFPWPHEGEEYLWFSPNPRAILTPAGLHISRRFRRTLSACNYRLTVDGAFEAVMRGCADREEGTWITESLIRGYSELHALGWAHSIETWSPGGALVGGIYGVAVGALFGAESMFHRARDASKVALVALCQHALALGVDLIDIQVLTPHTAWMGGMEIPRGEYLARARTAMARQVDWSAAAAR